MPYFFSEKLPKDPAARMAEAARTLHPDIRIAEQVHGDTVLRVESEFTITAGDALMTNVPGLCVAVKTADCVPVLLLAPQAVAAVHAGWRGTALRIAAKAVAALGAAYGVRPEEITAHIGPCVCQDCYETGAEVPQALGPEAAGYIEQRGEKLFPDLRRINEHWLRQAGVGCVSVSEACTCCGHEMYWSHRMHGTDRGVQLSGAWL